MPGRFDGGRHGLRARAIVLHRSQRFGDDRVRALVGREPFHLSEQVDALRKGWVGREHVVEAAPAIVSLVIIRGLDPEVRRGMRRSFQHRDVSIELLERAPDTARVAGDFHGGGVSERFPAARHRGFEQGCCEWGEKRNEDDRCQDDQQHGTCCCCCRCGGDERHRHR